MSEKRHVLNMQERLNILNDLEALQSISTVATKYKVHPTTIRRVKAKAAIIKQFANKNRWQRERQRIKRPVYEELEKRLLVWFIERQTSGNVIKDASLLEKAVELKESMLSCSKFKASIGWLACFKRRNDIRLVHAESNEFTSADMDVANMFVEKFKKLIEGEKINLENIYKMDVNKLLWKALPKNMIAEFKENSITNYKMCNERLTIGLCANATGNNKMMPLIVCLTRNPRALKHCRSRLPVIFKSQSNARMSRHLFIDWFENYFKPQAQAYQLEKGTTGKVLLLLDNCEEQIVPKYINKDPHFNIMCLPLHTKSILHPTDQRIVAKIKKLYHQQILHGVLNNEGGVRQFYKNYTIKNCIDILHELWMEITVDDIKNTWRKILGEPNANWDHIVDGNQSQCESQDNIDTVIEEPISKEYITILPSYEETISKDCIQTLPSYEETVRISLNRDEQVQEGEQNKNKIELKYLFERLAYHTENAPPYIKLLVESIRVYFREHKQIHNEIFVGH